MILSKPFQLFATIVGLASTATAAAVEKRQGGECSFQLRFARGQNPIEGGSNTLTCSVKVTYADGREETLSEQCNDSFDSRCWSSALPHQVCVTTNQDFSDGYIDYADEHKDFNEDGCTQDKWAAISGDGNTTVCKFAC
ncbi:hypothetical protein BJY04DRAFT_218419 [Aspergillus karnatakaensis]|uniref:uncharacterized protein n=1 Tax=Aspergillus karnatakaensis TaxID=1810916 RepID=UPI003CCCEE7F